MSYLSENIKFLRKNAKMTQEEFAKIVNKSRTLISQWETDDREITTEDIIKISNYYNIAMDKLVGVNLQLENNEKDELDILYNKYKHNLSEKDKRIIKAILEETKKEVEHNE